MKMNVKLCPSNKIKVTEEQAYYIKKMFEDYQGKSNRVYNLYNILEYKKISLDMVTIARIVEGEEYEVVYEIKEKDLVLYDGVIFEFVKKEKGYILSDGKYQAWRDATKPLILICKAEERHDLKEVSK
jgi:hypothetical protein